MKPRQLTILLALVALATVLGACGKDKNNSDSSSASQPTATAQDTSTQAQAPAQPAAPKAAQVKGDTNLSHKPKIAKPAGKPPTTLKVQDIVVGKGPAIKAGDNASVQYVGIRYSDGGQFDASWDRGSQPFQFPLGQGMVIPGWDQGVVGMKVGGRRQLTIPSDLAYGAQGTPDGSIPPNAPLIFIIDLKKIN